MDLKELLGEELYEQVKEKAGEHKIAVVSDGSYIPKEKFDDKLDDIKDLKQEIKNRDTQINKLEQNNQDNEQLKQDLADFKQKNEDWEKKYNDAQIESAIKLAAKDANDPADVLAFVKKDNLKLNEDGSITGLQEELNTLKESKPYLFAQEEPKGLKGREPHPSDPNKQPAKENPFSKESFNMTEQGQLIRNNPDEARTLIKQAGGNPAIYGL